MVLIIGKVRFQECDRNNSAEITQKMRNNCAIRCIGILKDKIKISKDFYEPLPEDIIALFEGRSN